MKRYFFDFVGCSRSEFDYQGLEMPSVEEARQFAELIAIDQSARGARIGWQVKVSDAVGKTYLSIPIGEIPELTTA